ncbi:hypothetical protein [Kribbella sp. NBC_00359]|uniref:hypothetical protein n=1 Tax=Kribbella sp. NBC_00359 TaxID=2975966 RepID=UPI002E24DE58
MNAPALTSDALDQSSSHTPHGNRRRHAGRDRGIPQPGTELGLLGGDPVIDRDGKPPTSVGRDSPAPPHRRERNRCGRGGDLAQAEGAGQRLRQPVRRGGRVREPSLDLGLQRRPVPFAVLSGQGALRIGQRGSWIGFAQHTKKVLGLFAQVLDTRPIRQQSHDASSRARTRTGHKRASTTALG